MKPRPSAILVFLAPSLARSFVLAGRCGIPATARAAAVNITVTQGTSGPGILTLYAGATPLPVASTIEYSAGQTRAANSVVSFGSAGDIQTKCQQPSGTVQLIIDISGYFQ